MGSFCPSHIKFPLKKFDRVFSHYNKKWCMVSKKKKKKKTENFFSMGSFCSKYIKFELQSCTSVMSCLSWHWTLMQNLNKTWPFSSKNDMRNRLNFHQSTQMSEKLYFDGLFLSKTFNVSAWKFHGNYVLWHGMVMQNFKENWRVAWKMT